IDMDLVLRDFAPLDSLIQVAGRCNRHGARERGSIEIVSLQDDEKGRALTFIYDKILLQVTHQVLGSRATIDEEEVFPLTRAYFALLSRDKDTGEVETLRWVRWEEMTAVRKLLRGAQRPQIAFLVSDNDPYLCEDLHRTRQIPDRW